MKAFIGIILTIAIIKQVYSQCDNCNYDEVCVNDTSVSPPDLYCNCDPALYDNPDFTNLLSAIPVSCGQEQLSFNITSCLGRSMAVANYDLPFENSPSNPCLSTVYPAQPGTATFVFNFTSENGLCNADVLVNSTYATFTVPVWFKQTPGQEIYFYSDLLINYTCSYVLTMNKTFSFVPVNSVSSINVAGVGTLSTVLQVCKDSSCTNTYTVTDMPITVHVGEKMFFQMTAYGVNNSFSLTLQYLYATPTNNPNDPTRYDLVANFCPVASAFEFYTNGNGLITRFSIRAFMFANANSLYIHAVAVVCPGTCTPNCASRDSKQPDVLARTGLSIGPFVVKEETQGSVFTSGSSGSFGASWILKTIPLLSMLLIKSM